MKILLIWPKAQFEADWGNDLGAIAEPLALEYLSAGLKENGHQIRLLDMRIHPNDLVMTLDEFNPDVVGVTAFSMHVRAALEVCRVVKKYSSTIKTVVGGHHATFHPEDFFEPQMDFIVCGEGVSALNSIIEKLEKNEPIANMLGIWSRVDNEFQSGGQHADYDVDSLPLPDREIAKEDRDKYFIDWMRPIALVRTTVGCPFRCTFCSLWQMTKGKYLLRGIDRVVDEISKIKEDFIFLVDDEAFIRGKRMTELAVALKAAGVKKRFFGYCRIDSLIREQEALTAWKEIGLERLFVGIDAITTKDLNEYNKKTNISQIEQGLQVAKDLGIELFAQFVINTDYSKRDFIMLKRFISHNNISYPTFTVLTPLPGTDLLKSFDSIVELQPNGRPNWDLFDTAHAVTKTTLPLDEFMKEYRGLFTEYRGIYKEHRERNDSQGLSNKTIII